MPAPGYIGPGAGITLVSSFFVLLLTVALLLLSAVAWPVRLARMAIRRRKREGPSRFRRVVVVGLDGLDPDRVERLMHNGRLPHFQTLARTGNFSRLGTTLPPISPVAWSSFLTGVNPGKHNIYDFLNRDHRTYLPELSSAKAVSTEPSSWISRWFRRESEMRLMRKSQPFWRILGDYGVFSTILRVPITFPPEKFSGHSLSAMCTPDLRGTQGTFTFYSSDESECEKASAGTYLLVKPENNVIRTTLPGPSVERAAKNSSIHAPLQITLDHEHNRARLKVCGQTVRLEIGKYTSWVRITFRVGRLGRVQGICRFRLESLSPVFRLYVTPLNIDPERPAMPISHPLYYSMYLSKLLDSFATLGLAEDTSALNCEAISEEAFLQQAYAIHAEREKMLFTAMGNLREGVCACVFDGPDRIQHMFYRHERSDHPANEGRDTQQFAGVIDAMYERMDDLVGRVMETIDDETLLFVLSDHGFCDFSRGLNLNVWLQENGYQFLRDDAEPGEYLSGVDWSRTRAYAFGLNGIYLNLKGRESRGIVDPGTEAASLKRRIAEELAKLSDGQRNTAPVRTVYDSSEVYHGPYVGNAPDLIVGFDRGYRTSWESVKGCTDGALFSDNRKFWSGDHCVDPALVPGILFCNHAIEDQQPQIVDCAPTILKLFGIPIPGYMDGRPLTFAVRDATSTADRESTASEPTVAAQ
ncbi:MAG: nucleotide pyrophosphatase [Planctomycetota bacterium]|nr:MAG: nucleotide pyrophosphatase [Planctomycetota bacterium]REJ92568.1 MAG: nucleotide pyrophosphatase [Planctomycetota bacterium]REK24985.1 MAG: nucleotide pyrophosphatase [Planctomycetota bacterium]REK30547.1 MAG: nucleotide pyrophosphatase [Planctomycetota bacterium]